MSYLHTRNLRLWRRVRQYTQLTAEDLGLLLRAMSLALKSDPEPVRLDRVASPWPYLLRRKAQQP